MDARSSAEAAAADGKGANLPARYSDPWPTGFGERVRDALAPGAVVLDVGCGSRPTIPPLERPAGCRYVALDEAREELAAAPAGSYDEVWVRDVTVPVPELAGRFDLAVSWNLFEHVRPLDAALANVRTYLRPGGRMIALLSGAFSAFALGGRLLPTRAAAVLMERLLGRDPGSVFRSHYDRCWYGALVQLLSGWSQAEVVPLYRGAEYFNFSPALRGLYLRYENWACTGRHRNLATHYLLDAVR